MFKGAALMPNLSYKDFQIYQKDLQKKQTPAPVPKLHHHKKKIYYIYELMNI